MPWFKLYARQWVEEIGEIEIQAESLAEALEADSNEDWTWFDGNDVINFEVMKAVAIDDKKVLKQEPNE